MHYMGTGTPPQVRDEGRRQKVFGYRVPIAVGARRGAIVGTLLWTPQGGGGVPAGALAGLAALALCGLAAVVLVRRRRTVADEDDDRRAAGAREAW
jgi:hypothetical protein